MDQAFLILRAGFTIAPILFGLDKFFNFMVDLQLYLAPWLDRLVPGTPQEFIYVVGAIEIIAGMVVASRRSSADTSLRPGSAGSS